MADSPTLRDATAHQDPNQRWVVILGFNPGVKRDRDEVLDSIVNVNGAIVKEYGSEFEAIDAWRSALCKGRVHALPRDDTESANVNKSKKDGTIPLIDLEAEDEDVNHFTHFVVERGFDPGVKRETDDVIKSTVNVGPVFVKGYKDEDLAIYNWHLALQKGRVHALPKDNIGSGANQTRRPSIPNIDSNAENDQTEHAGPSRHVNSTDSEDVTGPADDAQSEASSDSLSLGSVLSLSPNARFREIRFSWHNCQDRGGPIYVVYRGRKPGLYASWYNAHEQIHGTDGRYQLFTGYELARNAFDVTCEKSEVHTIHKHPIPTEEELLACGCCVEKGQ